MICKTNQLSVCLSFQTYRKNGSTYKELSELFLIASANTSVFIELELVGHFISTMVKYYAVAIVILVEILGGKPSMIFITW